MPGTNLTRDEARARAAQVCVHSYEVHIDLTSGDATFGSETLVRFASSETGPGSTTWLDLVAPAVHEVELNGHALDPAGCYRDGRLELADLQAENVLRVRADGAYMHTGEGLHRFVDPVDEAVYLYTQFEEMDARRVYACFDQPDLKATFIVAVTADDSWEVVSCAPTPAPVPVSDGIARWDFPATPPLATYVTAVVAGPYHAVRSELTSSDGRTIALGVFCRGSLAPHLDAGEVLEVTTQGFAFLEDAFGRPYPFEKYDQLFVPEFNAGAMENAGCVTITDEYVFRSRETRSVYEARANTVLHELAHMWFGDLVTMRWWDDLWLNESFAEWASYHAMVRATAYRDGWTSFAADRKAWAYREDQLPSTHPVAADMVDLETVRLNFDGITYAKGASAIRQLVVYVGEEAFLAALRRHFEQHAWGNATLDDLVRALEKSSGRNLGPWVRQWLRTSGVTTLTAQLAVADGAYSSVAVAQTAAAEHPELRPHRLRVGLFDRVERAGSAVLERRRSLESDVDGALTPLPDLVGEPVADLVLVNDGDLTYAKVRLDDRSLATVRDHLHELDDDVSRAVCWLTAIDLLRGAELPARDFVTLVLSSLGTETSDAIVHRVLPTARTAVHLYSEPATRAGLTARLRDGLRAMAAAADPGSDRQLSLVRSWLSLARGAGDVAAMRGLLSGEQVPSGLSVDTDLRWSVLSRLAAVGAADDDDIAAELRRDDTATGRNHAAYARAARPTAEAKRVVWRRCVEADDAPNAVLAEMLAGFAQPDQADLLRPYVDPYFEVLTRVWSERTAETARTVVTALFPRLLPEPRTLECTDAWLASTPQASTGLRRLVRDGRADVERALRAQACDAAAG